MAEIKPTQVPAEQYLHVADVIRMLTNGGVPIRDLYVEVQNGILELRDDTGSYGVHMWDC